MGPFLDRLGKLPGAPLRIGALTCVFAFAARTYGGTQLPLLETVFDQERPRQSDTIHLRSGEVLRGEIVNATLRVQAIYGTVEVPVARCAGISIGEGASRTDVLISVNYNRVSGVLRDREIRFRPASGEPEIRLLRKSVRTILFRVRPDEREFVDRLLAKDLVTERFRMSNRDLLTGRARERKVRFDKRFGRTVVLDLSNVSMIQRRHDGHRDLLKEERKRHITGQLASCPLTLELDLGAVVKVSTSDVRFFYGGLGTSRAAGRLGIHFPFRDDDPVPAPANPEMVNRVGMRFRLIPAGSFLMGAPEHPHGGQDGERPQHKVNITKPFYMAVTEVTQTQWTRVMGSPLCPRKWWESKNPDRPVYRASWDHAVAFAQRLSELDPDFTYRLPTEAEWEYACRAGTRTRFFWGEDRNERNCDSFMWRNRNSKGPQPVGRKRPNGWGLYDMSGNVWEWCSDWYARYSSQEATDPAGPATGKYRVLRGGSWNNALHYCLSTTRTPFRPDGAKHREYVDAGFRVVAVPSDAKRPGVQQHEQ